jgi:hypothetical protein
LGYLTLRSAKKKTNGRVIPERILENLSTVLGRIEFSVFSLGLDAQIPAEATVLVVLTVLPEISSSRGGGPSLFPDTKGEHESRTEFQVPTWKPSSRYWKRNLFPLIPSS